MYLVKLLLFILLGCAVARFAHVHDLESARWYALIVATLLATGLYASTYGIDLKEACKHIKIIVSAVTIGVVLKALIIGGSLAFLLHDPFFWILGITVAQIDPLSVAHLMKDDRMSAKAKTILASWASFDDPVTVILSLYAPLLVTQFTGAGVGSITDGLTTTNTAMAYVQGLGLNLLLAGGVLGLWFGIRQYAKKVSARFVTTLSASMYVLLAAAFSLSILYFLMLGIALVGLFLRPSRLEKSIEPAIRWALRGAAVLLGLLLAAGVNLWKGIALGVVAYLAQVVVGGVLTRGLPIKDRWHISFAQQNGITAIILALLFEPAHHGTVAIVAPAIITINGLHWLANKQVDKKLLRPTLHEVVKR